jgi:hypothetical protein
VQKDRQSWGTTELVPKTVGVRSYYVTESTVDLGQSVIGAKPHGFHSSRATAFLKRLLSILSTYNSHVENYKEVSEGCLVRFGGGCGIIFHNIDLS